MQQREGGVGSTGASRGRAWWAVRGEQREGGVEKVRAVGQTAEGERVGGSVCSRGGSRRRARWTEGGKKGKGAEAGRVERWWEVGEGAEGGSRGREDGVEGGWEEGGRAGWREGGVEGGRASRRLLEQPVSQEIIQQVGIEELHIRGEPEGGAVSLARVAHVHGKDVSVSDASG